MTPEQFWQKATDIYNAHHDRYRRDILTDDELRATVTDYIGDLMTLTGDWYNSENGENES